MTWGKVNHKHHGLTAEVYEPNRRVGMEPVMGVIKCEAKGVIPVLVDGDTKTHTFPRWMKVDIID